MFVILVYDIGEKRVQKILKIARKYLYRVQNSVFEGEISDANLVKLKDELGRKIVKDEDSVLLYLFRTTRYSEKQYMGLQKEGQDLMI